MLLWLLASEVVEVKQALYEGFHLYYLFIIFLVNLIVYKAETLDIKYNSSEITNTK
jgi:hypothetical protein